MRRPRSIGLVRSRCSRLGMQMRHSQHLQCMDPLLVVDACRATESVSTVARTWQDMRGGQVGIGMAG